MPSEYRIMDNLVISGRGCAYLPESETVAISDLHLGFEIYMESEGLFLPRLQMKLEVERIESILREYAPSTIVINGDVKHEFSRNTPQEWIEIRKLFDLLSSRSRVFVVRGNHDNYILNIAGRFGIRVSRSARMGGVLFAHGDVLLPEEGQDCTVIGHEHPAIRIVDTVGAYAKFPVFLHLEERKLLVLPAFSPFALGTDVLSGFDAFMSPYLKGADPEKATVYAMLEGRLSRLGAVADVQRSVVRQ